jgi:ABC-type multidrug transport system permease subunit
MSNLQNIQNVSINKVRTSTLALPAWRLVFKRELADLWISGKALPLILIYSILLGIMAYIYSFNTELSLLPPKEAVYEILKNAMAVSIFMGLIIGADSLSGERDRATLESLLLTPVSRRHILLGKLLAGMSTWPAAYIIAIPYLYVLAQGDEVLFPAIFWGAIAGTVLVLGYTGMGMLVSLCSSSNRASYFVSLGIYALLLVPAELPGDTVEVTGQILQWINPVAATNHFLSEHLVSYRPLTEFWSWLISSIVLAVVSLVLLLRYGGSNLRLEAGIRSKVWTKARSAIGLLVIAGLLVVSLLLTSPVYAFQGNQDLLISIDGDYQLVKVGDKVEFDTIISNSGLKASPSLIIAMNIINLDAIGEIVDPEDWSPERTQYIDSLAPGSSADLGWIIHPIQEGNFMVYMVLIPEPSSAETATHPVASSGIHLTVTPFTRLKPKGVLPFAIGEPLFLLAITSFVYRRRRQQIDMGGPS